MEYPIKVEDLSISFGDRTILSNITLQIHSQRSTVIIGRSGAGKSVLIKVMLGLIDIDKGDSFVFGKSVFYGSNQEVLEVRKRCGFVFQGGALFDSLTVEENLLFPCEMLGIDIDESVVKKAHQLLEWVGLDRDKNKMIGELSGGMQKRVGIVRSLMTDPELIFFDEPTSGLDPITGESLCRLLQDLKKNDKSTMVIVTHDFNLVRMLGEDIIYLGKEPILFHSVEELLESKDEEVKEYLRSCSLFCSFEKGRK